MAAAVHTALDGDPLFRALDDHEEGEIDDNYDNYIANPAANPIETPSDSNKHELESVVKIIDGVTANNACSCLSDACERVYEALVILNGVSDVDTSIVTKIVDKIRMIYFVYNATRDQQNNGVYQSLVKLASLYTDKLFTPSQLQQLKSQLQSVKGKTEDAYLPSEQQASTSANDVVRFYSSYASAFPMTDLPSPTPSEEDEAARYGKPLKKNLRNGKKREPSDLVTSPKRQKIEEPKEKSPDKVNTMKPRDPRRAFFAANGKSTQETSTTNVKPVQNVVSSPINPTIKPVQNVVSSPINNMVNPMVNPVVSNPINNMVNPMAKPVQSLVTPPHNVVNPVQDMVNPVQNVTVQPTQTINTNLKPILKPVVNNENIPQKAGEDIHPELMDILGGMDEAERKAFLEERQRRIREQEQMLNLRKLCLVLDLDHTLLNSAKFNEVEPEWDQYLRATETIERAKDGKDGPRRELYRFPHMAMWTKLRPGVWRFLARASELYELHLYTMGNRAYATEMAKLLDPTGVLFAGRVISKGDGGEAMYGDEKTPRSKDLDGVLGMESAVLIIDDSVRVWPHHHDNLIVVERYMYFPCSRRQFGVPGPSLLEVGHDEREADGTLSSILGVIERVHKNFYLRPNPKEVDVREVLASEQRSVLAGCKLVFSRIFPVGESQPQLHPLWRLAEQFGAVCTTRIEFDVTHVVALSTGTDKSNWAISTGKHLVRPAWVEASTILYRRANERDFPVPP